ncbi:hypothetical protein TSUD_331040 [Trifolium subterraneum]|uniref:Uncharacterized protein n=1 Tax=Trifolium subterraneum TaxID=3900 RepID=A0A2Z6N2T6_TRISU|nr:hypothetical protein TSUD_331040 [Trifolium subterraneum]
MEAIFRQAKVEQENADKAFDEEPKNAVIMSSNLNSELESDVSKAIVDSKPKGSSRKTSNQLTVTEEASPAKKRHIEEAETQNQHGELPLSKNK